MRQTLLFDTGPTTQTEVLRTVLFNTMLPECLGGRLVWGGGVKVGA